MSAPRIAEWMRRMADRIDHEGAPKFTGKSFTFEEHEGIRFREDGKGCPLAYLGDADYERAHTEADRPPVRIDWKALARTGRRGRWETSAFARDWFQRNGQR